MNEEKLIEQLKKTALPGLIQDRAKNELRRALLNSEYFEKRAARKRAFKYISSAAISAAAAAVLVIYLVTPHSFSSAEELLSHVESSYARLAANGPLHYMRSMFKTLTGPAPTEEEEWSYNNRQFRILTRDALSGAVLAHTIQKDGQMYSREFENRQFKFKIEENKLPHDGSTGPVKQISKETRVLAIPSAENPKYIQIFIFSDSWTPEKFSRLTPQEIIQILKSDLHMQYLGSETDAKGNTFEVLEQKEEQNVYLFQSDAGRGLSETVPALIQKIENKEVTNSEKIDVQQLIKIDSKTGKIYQVIHSVRKSGREIERFELTFLDEKFLNYDPGIFDPVQHGLTLISTR